MDIEDTVLNKSLTAELYNRRNFNVVILCRAREHIELLQRLRDKITQLDSINIVYRSANRIVLDNDNTVTFSPPQTAQISTRGITISLLLFSSSIEYNVRSEITRDLRSQLLRTTAGTVGILQI